MIDENLFNQIKARYLKHYKGDSSNWDYEKEDIERIINLIQDDIKPRYTILEPINIGGAGIVLKVMDNNMDVVQALKFARPVAGKEILLNKVIASEIKRLKESPHQYIVPVFYQGIVNIETRDCPFYIMEYIDNASDAFDFITDNKPSFEIILKILRQCVEGLLYLHNNGLIHGDVKLENVLVSPDGNAKISDLGSARLLSADDTDFTSFTFTRDFAHPGLLKYVKESKESDPNRAKAEIKRTELKPEFDIYAFGKNILRISDIYDIAEIKLFPNYKRNYIQLMAVRMLDGLNEAHESAINIPYYCFKELKYDSFSKVLIDLKKLTGEFTINQVIPELNHYNNKSIQISAYAPDSFTERLSKLLNFGPLKRLSTISQLGLMVQVYPTATHTRLEHVVGTFYNVARYCDSLWNDPINPFFKQIINESEINLVLIAALFHDIGQYPLAHDLEEADAELFSHQKITQEILKDNKIKEIIELSNVLEKEWKVNLNEVLELLDINPQDSNCKIIQRLLHSLIDGPIDADKLDYLIRDSNNLNVSYGKGIDFPRLLRCLTVVYEPTPMSLNITIGIHEKGKIPAESVAFVRYALFGSVYWHHTVRSVKAMLHRAVWESMPLTHDRRKQEYKDLKEDLYGEIRRQLGVYSENLSQTKLFQTEASLPQTPQLNTNDYQILSFIYKKTSDSGKELISSICNRKLFKRLLVISPRKNRELWDSLTKLRTSYEWPAWLQFQKQIQDNLILEISRLNDAKRTTSLLAKEYTEGIAEKNKSGEILFLIDIPGKRPGSKYPLRYLHEKRIANPFEQDSIEKVQSEDSIIWSGLADDFLESVGKIRVFCHPDFIDTVSLALDRPTIESVIKSSYEFVIQSYN